MSSGPGVPLTATTHPPEWWRWRVPTRPAIYPHVVGSGGRLSRGRSTIGPTPTATLHGVTTLSPATLDTWASLNHKLNMDPEVSGDTQGFAPSWVSKSHRRRLNAYLLLWAYRKNVARYFLKDANPKRRDKHREYGDAELIVQTIRAAVLGDGWQFLVEHADGEIPEPPTERDVVEGGPTLAELTQAHSELAAKISAAVERQRWFDDWEHDERVGRKVIDVENNVCGLGDGVYLVANDPTKGPKGRVRVKTYEPGFYFPVDNDEPDDFPEKVHLAWEVVDEESDRTWVRRITYELIQVGAAVPDDQIVDVTATTTYPYAPDEPSSLVCVVTDASWPLDALRDRNVLTLDASPERRVKLDSEGQPIERRSLDIDFIPVIHVPGTISESEMWGESVLLRIAQVLDDIAATDTDLATAAALSASPPISVDDTKAPSGGDTIRTYGPGQVFHGKVTQLDTSKSLDALLKFLDVLLNRLSINRQLPAAVLGRVNPSEVPSGIALLLGMGPFRQMIEDFRLIRSEKYELLLKFVQRIAIVGGSLDGPVLPASIEFGSFLPTDLESVKALVLELVKEHVITKATGLRMLIEAGIEITGTIAEELQRAAAEDFAGAVLLADATGDEGQALDYLGRERTDEPDTGDRDSGPAPGTDPEQQQTEPPTPPAPTV